MATAVNRQTMSDAELIAASRVGDTDAYGELHRRHLPAARAAARALLRDRSDVDDLVSEAFLNMLQILQNGNGPDLAFRPYLLVAVRNRFSDRTRRRSDDPIDEPTQELDLTLIDSAASQEDPMLAAAAFATLPERWQLVLWHMAIEGRSPAEVAPLIGLTPAGVAALAYRAREGLRQAYVQAHLQTPRADSCRQCAGNLVAYFRDGLSPGDRQQVDDHLAGCRSCRTLVVELTDSNTMLRAALVPAIVGVPATTYLSGLSSNGVVRWLGRLPHWQQAAAAATAVAATAAVLVGAAIVSTGGGHDPTLAAPPSTQPRAALDTVAETTPVVPTATSTPTTQLANLPPVVSTLPPTVPTGPINRVPVHTLPNGIPTTAPATTAVTQPSSNTVPAATVPVVPTLALTSMQLGVALLGGEARVQLTVAASALPTNQLRTNAFADLVVSIPLAAGVSLTGVDNPAWSCTAQGMCTVASLASGGSSTSVLRLGIAASAALPISFAPSVVNPANAVVQSQPLSITAGTIAGLQMQEYAHGSVAAIGNTVLDCTVVPCLPVDVDTDPGTINSSTADLNLTGTIAKALLVWSGDSDSPDRDKVKFITPGGSVDVVADSTQTGYSGGYANAYVAYKDVTTQVAAIGTYGLANLQTSPSSYGGWSLIVVTHDAAQPERSLMIAVPLTYVTDGVPFEAALAGPSTPPVAHVIVSAFEGDAQLLGDTLKLNGIDLVGVDPFHGAISGVPRNPELAFNRHVDLLDATAGNLGSGPATLDFATTNDPVMIAAMGIALDLS